MNVLPIERFWQKVQVQENGCWIWTGVKTTDGYGRFFVDGKLQAAHRWLYERVWGPVPRGMELAHIPECSSRACVCPLHVRPLSHRGNLYEAPTALATINRAKTNCPKGHLYDYQDTRGSRYCLSCIRERERARGNPNYIPPSERTHCPKGHPYEGDNLYVTPSGKRTCRICNRKKQERYMARKKEATSQSLS